MWNSINEQKFGLISNLSSSITLMDYNNITPDFSNASTLLITSDYGGEHQGAHYQTYSFLVTDFDRWHEWELRREQVRLRYLGDGRRMAFKNMNDINRRRALWPFLVSANKIHGIIITFAIHKAIESLFHQTGRLNINAPEYAKYSYRSVNSFEKMLRVVNFCAFLIAGLSSPGQNMWFSYKDEIVANPQRITEVTELLAHIASHYCSHNLGHLRCGNTDSDTGKRDIEDLVSIPDLIAGAMAEFTTASDKTQPISKFITPIPNSLSRKSKIIISWLTMDKTPLKKLVCKISPVVGTTRLDIKWLKFHAQPSPLIVFYTDTHRVTTRLW